jgi:response regulator RpfG family c-di-GMP phosphodiesterase
LCDAGHSAGWIAGVGNIFQLLKWRVPDVILLDWDSADNSSAATLVRLQRSPKHCDVPVVLFSSASEIECVKHVRRAGAADYIRKPVDPKLLVWRVDQVLGAHAKRPSQAKLQKSIRNLVRNVKV